MASKKNTITEHVQRVHHELAMINLMACSFEGTTRSLLKARSEQGLKSASFADLLGKYTTKDGRATASYGGYIAHGDNWRALIDEASRLVQLDLVANAFEIIEGFIKDVASVLLYSERGRIPVSQKTRQRVLEGRKIHENTPQYCRRVVEELARRNCDELFKIFFRHLPDLRNRSAIAGKYDLHEIHQIVECFRHCKAHKNGRCANSDFAHLSSTHQAIVKQSLKQSEVFGDQRVLPEHSRVAALLVWECEYTQIIYEEISLKLGMTIDHMPMIEPPKKPRRPQ